MLNLAELVQKVAYELAENVLGNIETVITLNPKADTQNAAVNLLSRLDTLIQTTGFCKKAQIWSKGLGWKPQYS